MKETKFYDIMTIGLFIFIGGRVWPILTADLRKFFNGEFFLLDY